MPNAHKTTTKPVKAQDAPAGSTDLIEQQAAEVARRRGGSRTTDGDRKRAYRELKRTGPKVSESKSPAH